MALAFTKQCQGQLCDRKMFWTQWDKNHFMDHLKLISIKAKAGGCQLMPTKTVSCPCCFRESADGHDCLVRPLLQMENLSNVQKSTKKWILRACESWKNFGNDGQKWFLSFRRCAYCMAAWEFVKIRLILKLTFQVSFPREARFVKGWCYVKKKGIFK